MINGSPGQGDQRDIDVLGASRELIGLTVLMWRLAFCMLRPDSAPSPHLGSKSLLNVFLRWLLAAIAIDDTF